MGCPNWCGMRALFAREQGFTAYVATMFLRTASMGTYKPTVESHFKSRTIH
ncbi:UNVERIFIED_CONTAM: hypothetical protein Slati_2908500 [Sesamum latifolium]|uniref:Uncharacterized protein n=1 Tax=Sesamum latifolium TaxID=2727402 RepID=A0AAW2VGP4_9LAMI